MKIQELRQLLREYEQTLWELRQLRACSAMKDATWVAIPELRGGLRSDIEVQVPPSILKDLVAGQIAALEAAGRGLATQLGIEFDATAKPEDGGP
jgi:hypothetical protein